MCQYKVVADRHGERSGCGGDGRHETQQQNIVSLEYCVEENNRVVEDKKSIIHANMHVVYMKEK